MGMAAGKKHKFSKSSIYFKYFLSSRYDHTRPSTQSSVSTTTTAPLGIPEKISPSILSIPKSNLRAEAADFIPHGLQIPFFVVNDQDCVKYLRWFL